MRRWSALAAIVGMFVALGVLAPSAGAVLKQLPNGRTVSYQPLIGTAPAAPKNFDSAFSNLDYNGGPVMASNTDYLIFWSPSGFTYPSDYQPGLEQYFTDLAHDSGGHQNVDSVAGQYNDASGNFAAYNMSYGGAFTVTTAYPASGCGAGAVGAGVTCLTDAQLRAELQSFITANGLPHDTTHEYFLMLPPGVQDCLDGTPSDGCSAGAKPAFAVYCAYHSATSAAPSPTAIIYSNDPYVTGNAGCDSGLHPNGTSDGALQGGLSHEHNESTTDPFPNTAWTDFTHGSTSGFENGDKCSAAVLTTFDASFGPPLGTAGNGSPYNQLINGHEYLYQQEWSNQGHACLQRFTFSGAEPTAQFTSTPGTGNTMNFDATGSTAPGGVAHYHWQFENTQPARSETESATPTTSHTYGSSGNHTVSLTVYAPNGTSIGASRVIAVGAAGPTAAFSINPTQVLTGQTAAMTSSSSAAGGDSISQQAWNFGDGTTGAGAGVSHAYSAPGIYSVTLLVTTTLGQTASATKHLVVTGPPVAAFTLSPAQLAAGSPVAFDGSGSNESGGSIAGYGWNFGDGTTGTGVTTSHAYPHAGTYTVTLSAADAAGNAAQATHQVVVVGTPSALITAATTPIAGLPTALSGAGSTDNGSTITSYSWKFGDGAVGSGAMVNHSYAHPGAYTATLTVTDASGSTSASTKLLAVKSAAIASASVKKGKKVEKITLVLTGPGTLTVGKHKFKIKHAGTFVYQIKLSKAQRNRLHQHHPVNIKLTFKFKPTVGASSSKTVSFPVKG